jgi:pimeloyl-ACP methyl ester carboxylesterase
VPNGKDVRARAVQFRVLRMYPAARMVRVNGRDLAIEDPGPESGFPVIVHNGAGSRHLFPRAVAEAQDRDFRLIGYDRPGCGGSTAMPGRVIADCAVDVQAIMTELGIAKAAAWGSSGGGPYALAMAATLPDAVAAVCVFASIGPYGVPDLDFCDGLGGDDYREEIRTMLAEPERARADFRARSAVTLAQRGSPEWWLGHWGDRAEQDAAHSRESAAFLAACTRDVLHAGDSGFFDDDGSWEDSLACYRPWAFDLADIQAPVSLWHGKRDFLPVAHARWLADRIPDVTTHFPADEDHTNIEENNRAAGFAWLTAHI